VNLRGPFYISLYNVKPVNCFRNKVEFWNFCEFYDAFIFQNPKIKILPLPTVIPVVSTSVCLCEAPKSARP
jgi:hypothetical protein